MFFAFMFQGFNQRITDYFKVLYMSGWNESSANKNNKSEEAFVKNKGICLAPE